MNTATIPSESKVATKQRLIEAAEHLFADDGFEKVSVRDITNRAGANVAAVNYHFGSREGLVEIVMARYINPISEERIARLEGLER
ncbi:MAG: transcriptional regulator, TetR family, partial [Akkermansiaceae bacterium]|nr:transcriptional regulator, TetR family [Akkermansiaceae bacterium]